MTIVTCKVCCGTFYAKPSHIKLGWGKYCSGDCRIISQRKGKEVACLVAVLKCTNHLPC